MDDRLPGQCTGHGVADETGVDRTGCVLLAASASFLSKPKSSREEQAMATITEQAWEAFHTPLHQFIRRRVADEATAEDLLQEVFLKIHQQGTNLRDARRLESWIYQI